MYEYNCKIVRVVDGDTVDVDIDLGFGIWKQNERIRLYAIDTPESRTRDSMEKIFGKMASAIVEKFLPLGSIQILQTVQDKAGKFGRVLATVITVAEDGTEIDCNNQLCIEGHARPYSGGKKIPWV